ncbi:MAG TPA: hypothetical protein DEQ20_00440 [Desulfobulbaceae bacterium]|nr:MAG: hypothetical protein A2520_04505 [Deltaproteobacteria bacterium RIFOXYD12_FULL_53_23]HCC53388.1 hypothetical protein [Desulfobulbaceae bacterium]
MEIFHPEILKQQLRDAIVYWLLIPAAVVFSGLAIDRLFGFSRLPTGLALTSSVPILLIAGTWLIGKATKDLKQYGHGTPNPYRPAKILVITSSYRWCRHPMFLGYDLAALSIILLCRSWAMLLISFPLMLVWQLHFLRKEEYLLSRRFQKDYVEYRKQVPMLLPWPRPKNMLNRYQ